MLHTCGRRYNLFFLYSSSSLHSLLRDFSQPFCFEFSNFLPSPRETTQHTKKHNSAWRRCCRLTSVLAFLASIKLAGANNQEATILPILWTKIALIKCFIPFISPLDEAGSWLLSSLFFAPQRSTMTPYVVINGNRFLLGFGGRYQFFYACNFCSQGSVVFCPPSDFLSARYRYHLRDLRHSTDKAAAA